MKPETLESVGAAGNKAAIAGASLTSWGWLTSNEFFGLIGAVVAIGGLMVTWYYKREANRRLIAEHALRVQERQIRIDLIRATGRAMLHDTDMAKLEADE